MSIRSWRAAACASVHTARQSTSAGFPSVATRFRRGTSCLRRSRRFPVRSTPMSVFPVMLPPGWERLVTRPEPTGSETAVKTMGIEVVAPLAARAAGVVAATITSTLRRTSLFGECGERLITALGESALDQDVLTFDVAERPEPFTEGLKVGRVVPRPDCREVADPPGLCRLCRSRPTDEDQASGACQEETAGDHRITSSARTSRDCGIVSPER